MTNSHEGTAEESKAILTDFDQTNGHLDDLRGDADTEYENEAGEERIFVAAPVNNGLGTAFPTVIDVDRDERTEEDRD